MKKVIVVMVAALLAGCGDAPEEVHEFTLNTAKNFTPEQEEKIKSSAGVLFQKCAALKSYLPDIVNNTAEIYDAEGFSEKRDFGWNEFVELDFEVSESPKTVPSEFHASGHHCKFRISGDELSTQKTVCAHICQGKSAEVDSAYSLYIGKSSLPKRDPL